MTHPYLPEIRATFRRLEREAAKHTVGGVLLADDLGGVIRRTASLHGATPEDVARWVGQEAQADG